jgi:hypothetical protein
LSALTITGLAWADAFEAKVMDRTGKPGTIANATMSAVKTKVVWIRMLFILCLGSGLVGVHTHHEEQPLSSQSTRTTPGMS